MGILTKLGFNTAPAIAKPVAAEAITLHPDARLVYGDLMAKWALGAHIRAVNPATGLWENVDKPLFEPDTQYALATYFKYPRSAEDSKFMSDAAARIKDLEAQLHQLLVTAAIDSTVNRAALHSSNASKMFGECPPPSPVRGTNAPMFSPNSVPAPTLGLKRGQVWQAADGNRYLILGNKVALVEGYNSVNDPDHNPIIMVRFDKGMKKSLTHRDVYGKRAGVASSSLDAMVAMEALTSPHKVGNMIHLYTRKDDHIMLDLTTFESVVVPR